MVFEPNWCLNRKWYPIHRTCVDSPHVPCFVRLIPRRYPTHIRGAGHSWCNGIARIGGAITPFWGRTHAVSTAGRLGLYAGVAALCGWMSCIVPETIGVVLAWMRLYIARSDTQDYLAEMGFFIFGCLICHFIFGRLICQYFIIYYLNADFSQPCKSRWDSKLKRKT